MKYKKVCQTIGFFKNHYDHYLFVYFFPIICYGTSYIQ